LTQKSFLQKKKFLKRNNKILFSNKYHFNKVEWRNNLGKDGDNPAVGRDGSRSIDGLGGDVGDSLTLVPDVGDETGVGVADSVGHDLGAAVGKLDAVFAGGRVSVAVLVVAEVGTAGVAVGVDAIAEIVCWRVDVVGLTVSRGGAVDGGRSIDGPGGVRSRDNPDQGGVSVGVWTVGADSGNKAEESNESLESKESKLG